MRPILRRPRSAGHAAGRGSASPDPINACLVITKQDAVTAVDEDLRDGKPSVAGRSIVPGAAASRLQYSGRGLHTVQVHVWRALPAGAARLKRTFLTNCEKRETAGLTGLRRRRLLVQRRARRSPAAQRRDAR